MDGADTRESLKAIGHPHFLADGDWGVVRGECECEGAVDAEAGLNQQVEELERAFTFHGSDGRPVRFRAFLTGNGGLHKRGWGRAGVRGEGEVGVGNGDS